MAFGWFKKLSPSFSAEAPPQELTFEQARPAFFKAVAKGDVTGITSIAAKFPDALGWENSEGTPLFIALTYNRLDSFKCLVGLGAHINTRDDKNDSSLERAARAGRKDFCVYLLEMGASVIGAESGARRNQNYEIADLIKRASIIRQEYLARTAPPPPPAAAATTGPDDAKITVLNPLQLKKPDNTAP